jgi:hypothetical protein
MPCGLVKLASASHVPRLLGTYKLREEATDDSDCRNLGNYPLAEAEQAQTQRGGAMRP